jgi:putative DNA primase/helicase
MTRQEAIAQILGIIDGAIAPLTSVVESPASENNVARPKPRGRSSSSSSSATATTSARTAPAAAADPAIPAASQPSSDAAFSARPVSSAGTEKKGSQKGGLAENDDAAAERAEERRREEELRRAALNVELADLPMTDLGNAERFRARFGHLFKWCPTFGWLFWDERRWARKGADERVRIAVHETARAIQDEAKACFEKAQLIADELGEDVIERATAKKKPAAAAKPKRKRKAVDPDAEFDLKTLEKIGRFKRTKLLALGLQEWGRDSEMNAKLSPVEKHAAPYLAVDVSDFDADPWKINFANGTIVIDRDVEGYVRFKPHDPDDLITKISPVLFDKSARCPDFDNFFARVQPDQADRRFLLAWKGYSLTGDANEQKLVVLHGAGRNGKGVFVRICSYIAGDYAKATPIETFLAEGSPRNASQPTPERAALPGVRMLTTSEPKKGAVLDEAFIKLVTGGDAISARELNKPQFEFVPSFKLTISGNHKPKINDQTESIWARVELVPWGVIIPPAERDLKLDDKLKREASGVLNLMLDGLRDWMDNGLVRSKRIQEATAKYREDSDQLGRFISDCIERAPGERVQSSVLYDLFIAWSKATGASEWKQAGFTNAMIDRDFETKKSNVMFFVDIRMTKNVNDFVDYQGKPLVAGAEGAPPRSALMSDRDNEEFVG